MKVLLRAWVFSLPNAGETSGCFNTGITIKTESRAGRFHRFKLNANFPHRPHCQSPRCLIRGYIGTKANRDQQSSLMASPVRELLLPTPFSSATA